MIKTHKVYYPIYANKDRFITLIAGGHASGKSHFVSSSLERLTSEMTPVDKIVHQIPYTRYAMVSANISIIPELLEKAELDGTQEYFRSARSDVTSRVTGSAVMFRGLKTSSGNQTAKLESTHGTTTFVVDKVEGWVSEKELETIMLFICQKGIQNRIFTIMNLTDNNHWAYKRFIENTHKEATYDGIPVQIDMHPNVLHIHTTHLSNLEDLPQEFINEVKDMKANSPGKYTHTVMGRWADVAEGTALKCIGVVKEFLKWCEKVVIGLNFGYTSDTSVAVMYGMMGDNLYVDKLFYRTNMLSSDLVKALYRHEVKVFSDSADPRLVQEIHSGGIKIYSVGKGVSSIIVGIGKMKSLSIFVAERPYNLRKEFLNYVWGKDKDGNYINQPIDARNHGVDATRYWVLVTLLGKIQKLKSNTAAAPAR